MLSVRCPGCRREVPVAESELGAIVITCAACETRFAPQPSAPAVPRRRGWLLACSVLLGGLAGLAVVAAGAYLLLAPGHRAAGARPTAPARRAVAAAEPQARAPEAAGPEQDQVPVVGKEIGLTGVLVDTGVGADTALAELSGERPKGEPTYCLTLRWKGRDVDCLFH